MVFSIRVLHIRATGREGERMSLLIDFIDETEEVKEEYVNLIREILGKAAQMEKIEDGAELSVTFVDNERIREINRDYRDKDQPTDVISLL